MPGITLQIDTSQFTRGANKAKSDAENLGRELRIVDNRLSGLNGGFNSTASSMVKFGAAARGMVATLVASYALAKLNEMRAQFVAAGSDAQETANKFAVVFSGVSTEADNAVEHLRNFYGMSRVGAQTALSGVGDLLTGLGMTQEQALKLSEQTVKLATDLASFTNYAGGAEGATHALTSALLGETEAAKQLGVVLTDDQMTKYAERLGKTWSKLDLAEKAQLRLNAAMEQSPNAIGDFARSMDSYANQVRIADAISRDFTTTVGESLVEAHADALKAINSNSGGVEQLADAISGFIRQETSGLGAWLADIASTGDDASKKISTLASVFVQVAYGTKAAWNGFQLVVDGIIGMISAVTTGWKQLDFLTQSLWDFVHLDFEGAKARARQAADIGGEWAKNFKARFVEDLKDLDDAIQGASKPEEAARRFIEAAEKARSEAAAKARSATQTQQKKKESGEPRKTEAQIAKEAKAYRSNLELVVSVIEELESKTGQYGLSVSKVNELIKLQAEAWREAGVPQQYIDQLVEIRKLEKSRESWAGAYLATKEYFTAATDMAQGFRDITTNAFAGMEDAIVNACATGKLSFSDMITSMITDLTRLLIRQSIVGPLAGALGNMVGNMFGLGGTYNGMTASQAGAAASVSGYAGMGVRYSGASAMGNAFIGAGSLSSYSGSIVTRPTLFTHGGKLSAYANGAGLMGEAGPEAILPLRRTRSGRLGVETSGSGEPVVNVNIHNSTGQQASTRTSSDNFGNKTIDVYVGDMAAKQMATPGTTLNRAVSSQTGIQRPAIKR